MNCKEFLSLDVASPVDVATILHRAAEAYRESASEVEIAWQDKNCGKVWESLAIVLDRAATSCEKACTKYGF